MKDINIEKKPGVYKITNKINNKIYIGSTNNCFRRIIREHKYKLINNKHENIYLQRAVNKYGIENFEFDVIEYIDDKNMLIIREQHYLNNLLFATENNLKFKKLGYNINRIAENCLGVKRSDETKKKLSKVMKGKYKGELNPNYGNKWSEEQKKHASNIKKGVTLEDRFGIDKANMIKREMAKRMKGKYVGKLNHMFGKKVSDDIKKKISNKLKDRYSGNKSFNYRGGYKKIKNKFELNDTEKKGF